MENKGMTAERLAEIKKSNQDADGLWDISGTPGAVRFTRSARRYVWDLIAEVERLNGIVNTYAEAARVIHLHLGEFCNGAQPYAEMIADGARKAGAEVERLRAENNQFRDLESKLQGVALENLVEGFMRAVEERMGEPYTDAHILTGADYARYKSLEAENARLVAELGAVKEMIGRACVWPDLHREDGIDDVLQELGKIVGPAPTPAPERGAPYNYVGEEAVGCPFDEPMGGGEG